MERDLAVLVDGKLNMSQQCPGSQEGQPCPEVHQAQNGQQAREGIVLLCSALGRPQLQCWGLVWAPQRKKEIKLSESIQGRARKMVKGFEQKPYEEQLRSLGLFILEETEGRPHCGLSFLIRGRGGAGTDVSSTATSDRTQGNGLMLCQGRFKLDMRKMVFTQRVAGHWNRLPRDMVKAPNLTEFKKCLDQHSQCLSCSVALAVSGAISGAGLDDPHGSLPTQDILCFYAIVC
ncbi:hypothetical protein DUI87_09110 [Hirundo rustica rustica]|uniref:Uncharacterized protein n=1 Tax=Hirundo rustica rustica TaxID=333673 RepID=A0A3M0KLT9_HIRRU|nr:hypothetical protein DUI87_09110 [Hirundo rustica rustica]